MKGKISKLPVSDFERLIGIFANFLLTHWLKYGIFYKFWDGLDQNGSN